MASTEYRAKAEEIIAGFLTGDLEGFDGTLRGELVSDAERMLLLFGIEAGGNYVRQYTTAYVRGYQDGFARKWDKAKRHVLKPPDERPLPI